MTEQDIVKILNGQREFFESGFTQSFEARLGSLETLKKAIESHQEDLCKALKKDLCKS